MISKYFLGVMLAVVVLLASVAGTNAAPLQPPPVKIVPWALSGNALTSPPTDFLGTTDGQPLVFKTSNTERMRVGATGNVGIGTTTPNEQLELTGNLRLPPTPNNGTAGIIMSGTETLIHTFSSSFPADNFFAGPGAGNLTMSGLYNTGVGDSALAANTTGSDNTATGRNALVANTTGRLNTATGSSALAANIWGLANTATGSAALAKNTTGDVNTATGESALANNASGIGNTATGGSALALNTTGSDNTATGSGALLRNTEGSDNTATGSSALANNTGTLNTATGKDALKANTIGSSNTAIGSSALANNTGTLNTATGSSALRSNTTGIANTAIGYFADVSAGTFTNATAIGAGAIVDASNKIRLGNTAVTVVEIAHDLSIGADLSTDDDFIKFDQGSQSLKWDNAGDKFVFSNDVEGTTFTGVSDRNVKTNFATVDARGVLARLGGIPIETWNFKSQDPSIRHMGPTSQDFYAAFKLGAGDKSISTVDADGVALAAIQGLYQIVQEQDARIEELEARLVKLEQPSGVSGGSTGPKSSSLPVAWLLFGGLALGGLVLGGLLTVQRTRRGD